METKSNTRQHQATTFYYQNEAQQKSFDVAPLLLQLERTNPAELACDLEAAIVMITDFHFLYNHLEPQKTGYLLENLRTIRNSLLKGADIIDF